MATFTTIFQEGITFTVTEVSRYGGYNDCSTSILNVKVVGTVELDIPLTFRSTPKGGTAEITITSTRNNSYMMDIDYDPGNPATKKTFKFMESDPFDPQQLSYQIFPLRLYSEGETTIEVQVTASNQIEATQGWVIGSCNAYPDAASTYAAASVEMDVKKDGVSMEIFTIQDNQDYYYNNEDNTPAP